MNRSGYTAISSVSVFNIGDYVEYTVDKTKKKGVIKQKTACLYSISPDNAHYYGQVDTVAFTDLFTGEISMKKIYDHDEFYLH